MTISISRASLDAIRHQAEESNSEECCGLLLADPASPAGQIDMIQVARNAAADRRRRFEIDPGTLIRAHRAGRNGGPLILGCYHSHPGGNPLPSAEDAAQADPNKSFWLICAGPPWTITAWQTSTNGKIHGRFDPVEIVAFDLP